MVARRRHKHNGSNISKILVVKIWATANRLRNELGLENDAIPYGFYTAVKNKLLQNGERLAVGTIKLWLLREKTGNTNQLSRSGRSKTEHLQQIDQASREEKIEKWCHSISGRAYVFMLSNYFEEIHSCRLGWFEVLQTSRCDPFDRTQKEGSSAVRPMEA